MIETKLFDEVVLSTDSELIARTCMEIEGFSLLRRPPELAEDEVPSIPVFRHLVENFPCDLHLNYNCNFPECPQEVFERAIEIASVSGEALSDPYAVWAQTDHRLRNYGNPCEISAEIFSASEVHPVDVHTMDDLLAVHRAHQDALPW